MRARLALMALLGLAACKGFGLSEFDTHGPETPPGISHLNTESPDEAADRKWFGSYYGGNHGWGWDSDKADSPNCDFYSTCKGQQQDPTGHGDDRGGGLGW